MSFALVLVALFGVLALPPFRRRPSLASARDRGAIAAGMFFVVAGLLHFVHPGPYDQMIPETLPWPRLWTYLSGAAEIAGGIGLFMRSTRRAAAWGLVLLLFAVLPANINVAVNALHLEDLPMPPWYFWLRIPFQLFYVGWVVWAGRLLPRRAAYPSQASS